MKVSCYNVSHLLCYVKWDRWINTLCMRDCHYSFISCLSARPAKPSANTQKKQDSINGWQTGWLMKTKHYFTQPRSSPYTALGVLWLGTLRYREHAKANLVLACPKLPVQGVSQGEVDSAVSSTLMDPFFCWFCKVSQQRLQIPPTILLKLCSRVVKQCHFWNENEDPRTSNLSAHGRQSYHFYWASMILFPLSSTSPWVPGHKRGKQGWASCPAGLVMISMESPHPFDNTYPELPPGFWKCLSFP